MCSDASYCVLELDTEVGRRSYDVQRVCFCLMHCRFADRNASVCTVVHETPWSFPALAGRCAGSFGFVKQQRGVMEEDTAVHRLSWRTVRIAVQPTEVHSRSSTTVTIRIRQHAPVLSPTRGV